VRISKIKNLEDDIALSLAALGIRIIAPMPGKGTIGIEVPNQHPEMVSMRSVLATEKFQNTTMDLPIALVKPYQTKYLLPIWPKCPTYWLRVLPARVNRLVLMPYWYRCLQKAPCRTKICTG
jgi:S-DNA-T family DNA segregation ATPase FtsK/SpoIIIE